MSVIFFLASVNEQILRSFYFFMSRMKLPMTIHDATGEMEITIFDNYAESMTNLKLNVLVARDNISQHTVPEQVQNIIHKKFTMVLGLSSQAVIHDVLTYRVYCATPIVEVGEGSRKGKEKIEAVASNNAHNSSIGLPANASDNNRAGSHKIAEQMAAVTKDATNDSMSSLYGHELDDDGRIQVKEESPVKKQR